MSYGTKSASELVTDSKPNSALRSFHQELSHQNKCQTEVITQIADRLHEILNKRNTPKVAQVQDKENTTIDWASKFNIELDILISNNNRLQDILCHIDEIV